MHWKRVQGKEPYGSRGLSLEDEQGRLYPFVESNTECPTLLPFEAKEKKIWIDD
jgi:hypothetical protein